MATASLLSFLLTYLLTRDARDIPKIARDRARKYAHDIGCMHMAIRRIGWTSRAAPLRPQNTRTGTGSDVARAGYAPRAGIRFRAAPIHTIHCNAPVPACLSEAVDPPRPGALSRRLALSRTSYGCTVLCVSNDSPTVCELVFLANSHERSQLCGLKWGLLVGRLVAHSWRRPAQQKQRSEP